MGAELFLDSGTLTPLLKSLEQKGYIERERDKGDERILNVTITESGEALKDQVVSLPKIVANSINIDKKEVLELYRILYKILMAVE